MIDPSAVLELLWATAASFVGLAAMFVPLERAFPRRAAQPVLRPRLAVDLAFFLGQYLAWNAVSLTLLAWVERVTAGALDPLHRAVASLPTAVTAIAVLLLGDLSVYAFHRASHRFDLLWRFHAVHHSARHLDWVAAHREHPIDGILTQAAANAPALLLGVRLDVLVVLVTLRGLWAAFVHANVKLPLGPLRWLLGAPELHHWHHARGVRETHNFANLAPWVDLVFGTHHLPADDAEYELGLDEPYPEGYLAMLAEPFRRRGRARAPSRVPASAGARAFASRAA